MKSRRYIACLMILVYLTSFVGASWSVLSCPCLGHKHEVELVRCELCASTHSHAETPTETARHGHFVAHGCCGHDHGGEVELYTFNSNDNNNNCHKIVICQLVEALIPAFCATLDCAARPEEGVERPWRVWDDPALSASGLRAPPARV